MYTSSVDSIVAGDPSSSSSSSESDDPENYELDEDEREFLDKLNLVRGIPDIDELSVRSDEF